MAQIAWYPLNDFDLPSNECDDISANDYDGTFNGTWNYREEGPLGAGAANVKSVRADSASTQRIAVDTLAPNVLSQGTAMIWAKIPSGAMWGNTGAANGTGVLFFIETTTSTVGIYIALGINTAGDVEYGANGNAPPDTAFTTSIPGDNDWHHYAVTWKDGVPSKLYIDGAILDTASSNGVDETPYIVGSIGNVIGSFPFIGNLAQFKVYDTPLTTTEINTEKDIYLPLETSVRIPCPNLKLKELRQMWKDVERTHPETCTIQVSLDGTSFSTIYENVPCSLELTGTRQELNSADEYETIQNWVVTISGRYLLPVAANYPTIRFVVENGLTIDGYTYYQSPCDIQTVIEGQLV
jgi:hypothetical protein